MLPQPFDSWPKSMLFFDIWPPQSLFPDLTFGFDSYIPKIAHHQVGLKNRYIIIYTKKSLSSKITCTHRKKRPSERPDLELRPVHLEILSVGRQWQLSAHHWISLKQSFLQTCKNKTTNGDEWNENEIWGDRDRLRSQGRDSASIIPTKCFKSKFWRWKWKYILVCQTRSFLLPIYDYHHQVVSSKMHVAQTKTLWCCFLVWVALTGWVYGTPTRARGFGKLTLEPTIPVLM